MPDINPFKIDLTAFFRPPSGQTEILLRAADDFLFVSTSRLLIVIQTVQVVIHFKLGDCRILAQFLNLQMFFKCLNLQDAIKNGLILGKCCILQREGLAVPEVDHCCNFSWVWCQVHIYHKTRTICHIVNIYRVFFFTGPPLKKTKSKIVLEYPDWASPKSSDSLSARLVLP